jgi:Helix-turn-helix
MKAFQTITGSELRAWRDSFGLSQQELAEKSGVTRQTVQNWEGAAGPLSKSVATGIQYLDRRLRQEDPLRGPVTLVYADGPMFISPYGPRRVAMMQQETHTSNAAVLARVRMLMSGNKFFNPFVMEGEMLDLWNMMELQNAIDGRDDGAPTVSNMLHKLTASIRTDAPNYVRTGPKLDGRPDIDKRVRELEALSMQLERIAVQSLPEILGEYRTIEAILGQVRSLGLRPKDNLVSGLAQAYHAAHMPVE